MKQTILFYAVTVVLLILSFLKDKRKTITALLKSWKAFENILPQFLTVILFIGLSLAFFKPEMIGTWIGKDSGWFGTTLAALIGAITLIPGYIAFPMTALLLNHGAGYMQLAAFISSLMMVGVITLPVEISYFGKKTAILRNLLAFLFSFVVAWVIGKVMQP